MIYTYVKAHVAFANYKVHTQKCASVDISYSPFRISRRNSRVNTFDTQGKDIRILVVRYVYILYITWCIDCYMLYNKRLNILYIIY